MYSLHVKHEKMFHVQMCVFTFFHTKILFTCFFVFMLKEIRKDQTKNVEACFILFFV